MKVEPFRNKDDIARLQNHLRPHPRNFALFIVGINCGLRASDLLKIQVRDVQNKRVGETFYVRERKTKKQRYVMMNNAMRHAIDLLLNSTNYAPHEPLFQGTIRGIQLTRKSLHTFIKQWATWLGLHDNYGTHSLRKTFIYCLRVHGGIEIGLLQKLLNHQSTRDTMLYAGIEDAELNAVPLQHEINYGA